MNEEANKSDYQRHDQREGVQIERNLRAKAGNIDPRPQHLCVRVSWWGRDQEVPGNQDGDHCGDGD